MKLLIYCIATFFLFHHETEVEWDGEGNEEVEVEVFGIAIRNQGFSCLHSLIVTLIINY